MAEVNPILEQKNNRVEFVAEIMASGLGFRIFKVPF